MIITIVMNNKYEPKYIEFSKEALAQLSKQIIGKPVKYKGMYVGKVLSATFEDESIIITAKLNKEIFRDE